MSQEIPSLYGITHSNRDFSDPYYWGKNQFNSSFPISMACYMRDKGIDAVYLKLGRGSKVVHDALPMARMFGSDLANEQLFFSFESRFEPFREFVHDELKPIDVVVGTADGHNWLQPLEIKLTTLPDSTTDGLSDEEYGCEIVVRSPTMRYMALSMALSLKSRFKEVNGIFEPSCLKVRSWDNPDEIANRLPMILEAVETFVTTYSKYQKPLLMQPVWKTVGRSSVLADNCLDVFVWSDFALTRLFMDAALANVSGKITRQQRAAVRLARFLFEVSRSGKVYQEPIYDGMTLGNQTDKEFAISGAKTHGYMSCDRLARPSITKEQIKEIVLGGGQKWLSPERRFDAIIYFSNELFDNRK
ncbi:MAG: HindVP family restriction endonuclease [Flavobacteriales bacterium]|nr:HindVP family restriction endonuclease [Flavobacteriales bacterium]